MFRNPLFYTFLLSIGVFNVFGQWEPCGNGLPQGAYAFDMVTVGNELLIATDAQIYRSGILGDNWSASSTGLPSSDQGVMSLMVHQGRVFAGSDSAIYYSDDNGFSWSLSLNTGKRVLEFAEDNVALYAVTHGGGCLKSTDNGLTWQTSNNGLQTDTLTNILAVDNKLYIGSRYYGLYISEDSGVSWTASVTSQDPINVQEVITNGSEIFIGLRLWPHGSHYIMKSSDLGSTWSQITSSIFYQGYSILATTGICVGSAVLFAGEQVFLGSDFGTTWENYSQGSSFPYYSFHATNEYIFLCSGDYFSPELLYRRPLAQVLDVNEVSTETETLGLYPNPASTLVNLKVPASLSSIQKFTVTDQLGKAVISGKFENSEYKIPIDDLSDGAYVVSVSMADGSILNEQFMVQH